MRIKILGFVLLLSLLPVVSSFALSSNVNKVLTLLNNQFAFMKKVATFKYENNIPVIVEVHERVILRANIRRAAALGIEPISARNLITVQLDVIHHVQQGWIDYWKKQAKAQATAIQSTDQLQNIVIQMNNQIWQAIIKAMPDLSNPALSAKIVSATQKMINQPFITTADKIALGQALTNLKLQTGKN